MTTLECAHFGCGVGGHRRGCSRFWEPAPIAEPPICRKCGREVELARRCYATPMCYACLPPPPPLPTAEPPLGKLSKEERQGCVCGGYRISTGIVHDPWCSGQPNPGAAAIVAGLEPTAEPPKPESLEQEVIRLLNELRAKLGGRVVDLSPEAEEVLNKNLWRLYE